MKFTTSSILALLAAFTHAAQAPLPPSQAGTCNPNPHGRFCSAILYGAAGVHQTISHKIDYLVFTLDVPFSVSQIQNLDTLITANYEYWIFFGSNGSVTHVAPGQTADVGPPQVQTSALCYIECPNE